MAGIKEKHCRLEAIRLLTLLKSRQLGTQRKITISEMEKQVNVFIISCAVALCMVTSATSRSAAYELLHEIQAGSSEVTLRCRSETTLKYQHVNDTIFWRNRMTAIDAGLRERNDIMVTETADQRGIRFNLTRDLEGYYSCGKRIDCTSIDESPQVTLICES